MNSTIQRRAAGESSRSPKRSTRSALRFVPLIDVLSFLADFTYECSRSILGQFLASLQASATVIGVVTGFGVLLRYSLRLVSGRLADLTDRFCPITIFGYVLRLAAVPALAMAGSWPAAAVLVVLERVGKAVRNPPRDVMLSHAGKRMGGYGWAFGSTQRLTYDDTPQRVCALPAKPGGSTGAAQAR